MFRYRWLVYINPNYYGLSSVAFFVLSEFDTDCTGDHLECYITSGPYILRQFFFDKINPYLHLVVSYFCKYCPIDQLIIIIYYKCTDFAWLYNVLPIGGYPCKLVETHYYVF